MRSLGEDVTLGNVLQMLDEHYDIMMTFNALSNELIPSSRKQERIWLSLKYAVTTSSNTPEGYPGRIQQEHVEEVKARLLL